MKKLLIFSCAVIVLSLFTAGLAYTQSLEQIKASVRAEVREEMGLDQPERRPARQDKKSDAPKRTGLNIPQLDTTQQVILILMVIALIPATIAKMKGRSFIAWWVLGVLCFIVVIPASIYMKKIELAPDMRSI